MGATIYEVFFNVLLYAADLLLLKRALNYGIIGKEKIVLSIIAFALMCFFPYAAGDYFHYKDWYDMVDASNQSSFENVYELIALNAPSYFVFRVIVWGGALLLTYFTFKISKVDFALLLLFFFTRYFIVFSYGRVSLCMAFCFCGLALFSKAWDGKYLVAIIGLLLLFLSLYFHKTGLFGVVIALISILFVKQNRFIVFFFLLLLPVLLYGAVNFIDFFVSTDFGETEFLIENGQRYFERGSFRYASITKSITDILWQSPFLLIIVMFINSIMSGKFNDMPIIVRLFANASALAILISLLFLIIPDFRNYNIYYRFLNYAMIPSVVFCGHCYRNDLFPILVKSTFNLSLIAVSLQLLYRVAILM